MRIERQPTVFQSTKAVLSSTATIAVTTAEVLASTTKVGGAIIHNNLKAMYNTGIRDNVSENAVEVDESLDFVDLKLDSLDSLDLATLTPRQQARVKARQAMWESVAQTIEATIKL